ncbi:MAG: sigma 54-interacting transcriptional regulator [Desulfobacter sp.]
MSFSDQIDTDKFFRQATLRICSSLDIEKSLDALGSYLKEFMPADALCLCFYEPEKKTGHALAGWGMATLHPKSRMVGFPESLVNDFFQELKRGYRIEIINDIDAYTGFFQTLYNLAWQENDVSLLLMDLELDDENLGCLLISAEKKNRFREEHLELIRQIHEPIAMAMANGLKHQALVRQQQRLKDENRFLNNELKQGGIIGAGKGLSQVMGLVQKVAPTQSPVLLTGETGVGKEILAEAIHSGSPLSDKPFIRVNCGAIPDGLIDSELFGHEKGAFTGADKKYLGRFERAHQGTLFLDEIGELPLQAQVRLLRVLQNKEIERVGGSRPIPVNVRVISATNKDLGAMAEDGCFRKDLLFRLDVFPIHIPPLRDRKEDIPDLADFFIDKLSREMGLNRPGKLNFPALDRLLSYEWPGNVRELQNIVERELIIRSSSPLAFDGLGLGRGAVVPGSRVPGKGIRPLEETLVRAIRDALSACGGKVDGQGGAAELLGLNPSTLRSKMRKLNIAFGRNQYKTRPR